jgi:hypothetical protein
VSDIQLKCIPGNSRGLGLVRSLTPAFHIPAAVAVTAVEPLCNHPPLTRAILVKMLALTYFERSPRRRSGNGDVSLGVDSSESRDNQLAASRHRVIHGRCPVGRETLRTQSPSRFFLELTLVLGRVHRLRSC